MSNHPIGKGVVALIEKHEPAMLKGDPEATARVILDLATSVAGVLAFVIQFQGEEAAKRIAGVFAEHVADETAGIFDKAHILAAKRHMH